MNMSRTTRSNSVGPGGVDNMGKLPEEEGDLREFIKNVVAASQAALMGQIAGLENKIANMKEEHELAIVTLREKHELAIETLKNEHKNEIDELKGQLGELEGKVARHKKNALRTSWRLTIRSSGAGVGTCIFRRFHNYLTKRTPASRPSW